ncbi:hypothetical protein F4806DRAFT_490120 [Annulohypoxylon nitens]|nr:hypothetical protein F4806DRAFT_490120 [Annulohypoxylon nitens]
MKDYHVLKVQYLSLHQQYRDPISYEDIPSHPVNQSQLVQSMFEAAYDITRTYEHAKSLPIQDILNKKHTDVEYELVLWQLLESIGNAQRGICRLPNYLDCGEPLYEEYGSFGERFDTTSKEIVRQLFRDSMFADKLAWRPRHELRGIVKNDTKFERTIWDIERLEASGTGALSTEGRRKSAGKKRKIRHNESEDLPIDQTDTKAPAQMEESTQLRVESVAVPGDPSGTGPYTGTGTGVGTLTDESPITPFAPSEFDWTQFYQDFPAQASTKPQTNDAGTTGGDSQSSPELIGIGLMQSRSDEQHGYPPDWRTDGN